VQKNQPVPRWHTQFIGRPRLLAGNAERLMRPLPDGNIFTLSGERPLFGQRVPVVRLQVRVTGQRNLALPSEQFVNHKPRESRDAAGYYNQQSSEEDF
jgi:hypothetical protein